ncbi:unnamed protein product [Rotaria magnacalcarata]|uniref:HTH psq-type domain-containing protein n=1 Tax=Rotaria magnacalcarata TaxID=392030 RepID=A0A8S2YXT4_9BILA|nr:unnamed protein product [Rotaria magnacalcarata]
MGVAIQTLSVRMMLPHLRQNAPAKLVIPTLEWRRALYAQTPAPSEMEVVIQTPFAHTTTQRMQWFVHAKRVTPILQYRRKLCAQQSLIDAVNSALDSKSAAKLYNVPASTIRRHRRNRSLKNRIGRLSYLTTSEESYFVALLQLLPDFGIQPTGEVALKLANDYFKSLGLSDNPRKK